MGSAATGDQLPYIASLLDHYRVPGLDGIRQAQQLLTDDGLIQRQGIGAFVLRFEPQPRPVAMLAELSAARAALNTAIAALEKAEATGCKQSWVDGASMSRSPPYTTSAYQCPSPQPRNSSTNASSECLPDGHFPAAVRRYLADDALVDLGA